MIKNFLIAAACLIASPALVFSQDLFLSFAEDSLITSVTQDSGSGSAYLFSEGNFGFDALDLDFLTSDSSVLRFTGGEAFNPTFDTVGGSRFNSSQISIDPATNTGTLFSINATENGVNPALSPLFDPGFDPNVGPEGSVLLARLDFDIGGSGSADIELGLGFQGALQLPTTVLNPTFGSVSVTNSGLGPEVVFPELPAVEPPVDPPVQPPVDPPVEPPVDPPVQPPVDPPVQPPVEPAVTPDLFVSLDPNSFVSTDNLEPGTSGTAFIFSDGLFGFDAADVNITSTDSSVLLLTDGEAFNPEFAAVGGTRFDSATLTIDGDTANLFAVNVSENGINPSLSPLFDPGFDPEVGPNGAVLLAEVNFDLLGDGLAGIELSLGPQGILSLPDISLAPSFGSSVLNVGSFTGGEGGGEGGGDGGTSDIPEPSSVVVLVLGSVGMLARRRKSL